MSVASPRPDNRSLFVIVISAAASRCTFLSMETLYDFIALIKSLNVFLKSFACWVLKLWINSLAIFCGHCIFGSRSLLRKSIASWPLACRVFRRSIAISNKTYIISVSCIQDMEVGYLPIRIITDLLTWFENKFRIGRNFETKWNKSLINETLVSCECLSGPTTPSDGMLICSGCRTVIDRFTLGRQGAVREYRRSIGGFDGRSPCYDWFREESKSKSLRGGVGAIIGEPE